LIYKFALPLASSCIRPSCGGDPDGYSPSKGTYGRLSHFLHTSFNNKSWLI